MTPDQLKRFEKYVHVEPNTGCWLWAGATNSTGYGEMFADGRSQKAHRLSYEHWKGSACDLHVCHHCDTPACCNPDHLFAGTAYDNAMDMVRKGRWRSPANRGRYNRSKTHCFNGHPFDDANTVVRMNRGGRRCRACNRAYARKHRLGLTMPGEPIPVEDEGSDDKEAAE